VVVLVVKKEKFRGTMEENEEDDGFSRARAFFDSVVFGPKASSAKDAGTFDRIPFQHCSNLRRLKKDGTGVACELFVAPELCNRFGTLHGGCIATLVDALTTCALLVQDQHAHKGGGVTTDLHVSCVKSAKMHTTVTCEAVAKRLGRTMGFSTCELRDEKGDVVATGSHTKFLGATGPKL
tara:strand:- start:2632 stop:3171 length:540 start_codon:yes stop_codon:yes gene_type:complete